MELGLMDVLILGNKAFKVFPNGAPTEDTDERILRNYVGDVEEGWDYNGTTFVEPPANPINEDETVRIVRNNLLNETDWIIVKQLEMNGTVSTEWSNYRQALRDIPDQTGFPTNVNWPTKPTE